MKKGDKLFQKIKLPTEMAPNDRLRIKDINVWKQYANSYYYNGLIMIHIFSNRNNYKILDKIGIDKVLLFSEADRLASIYFSIRHYIELILKLIIMVDNYNSSDKTQIEFTTHSISEIWPESKEIVLSESIIEPSQIDRLENIIKDFEFVDNNSTRFRYSHDKQWNCVFNLKNHFVYLPAQTNKTIKRLKKLFDFIIKELIKKNKL
ncbi:MAG: hypothetical protein KGY75_06975 [Candidatus Cloacimonetes bacterium]|nr:hypothetical protein [Candidatus Cloacimonadota bacterium]